MRKVVVSLSGGMDSLTLTAYYLEHEYEVYPVIFTYGSKHNKYENEAALKICHFWDLDYRFINLQFMSIVAKSNLMKTGGEIPEGYYEDENMKLTVVPGRNLIFASILASYAESNDINSIALGVHSGDHLIYPDCRPEFIDQLRKTILLSTENKVTVEAPFLHIDKTEILKLGYGFNNIIVPYELTRTCYKDQKLSCGSCGSCTERLEAFRNIGAIDPIDYQK
jgi:7-cyano-7-deazaguanine synthase